jgi:beta-fructofuranosidase
MEPYHPTIANHWVHALTIPRELELKEGKLYQKPVEELKKLRKNKIKITNLKVIEKQKIQIEGLKGTSVEFLLDALKVEGDTFQIFFRNEATLVYNSDKAEISLLRRNVKTGVQEKRTCHISRLNKLHVFMDTSSIEIFINEGEEVFTARFFPDPMDESLIFYANKADFSMTKWDLDAMKFF